MQPLTTSASHQATEHQVQVSHTSNIPHHSTHLHMPHTPLTSNFTYPSHTTHLHTPHHSPHIMHSQHLAKTLTTHLTHTTPHPPTHTHQPIFEDIQQPREVAILRGRVVQVYHVEVGPDPLALTHTKVHLPPVLLHLHKHRSFTEDQDKRRRGSSPSP